MIDTALVRMAFPLLLGAAQTTLIIAFFSGIIGLVGGILLGIAHVQASAFVRSCVTVFTTIIRGTPMLLQIMFFYLMLPEIGIQLSELTTAVVAIGINSSAYISQIVRTGIASVSKGQQEAARTLGLSSYDIMRYIVLPQALRMVIPSLGNEFITLIKDSSLASAIGVVELYMRGGIIVSQAFNALSIYTLVGCMYLCMTSTISYLFIFIERGLEHRYVKH